MMETALSIIATQNPLAIVALIAVVAMYVIITIQRSSTAKMRNTENNDRKTEIEQLQKDRDELKEEVKALKSMAIPPVQYLVVPRFIALSITTPILSFSASIVGSFAGFLIAYFFCDISFSNYMMGLRDGIDPMTFLKSTIKALVFGWIVTLIACNKGLNAHGGAEAVGKATTSSVVAAICTIVISDTLFAFIFY